MIADCGLRIAEWGRKTRPHCVVGDDALSNQDQSLVTTTRALG